MKKLLAGLLIGGLFSLGCGDTATKPAPKKDTVPPPVNKKMNGKDEDKMKDEGAKPEPKKDDFKPEPKKDDSKKNEPKKDSK